MTIRKKFMIGFLICSLSAIAVFIWQIQKVSARRNSERSFGLVSLNAGQTARFNVVSLNNSTSRRMTLAFDIYSLGGPDTISDSANRENAVAACTNNLRFVRRESCEVTLLPGEAVSLEFSAASADTRINAVMLGGPDTIGDPTLLPTLEIRENNRTVFIHPATIGGFNPQPDPPR